MILISILIPIFNFDVIPMVTTLNQQCQQLGIVYEIICIDDGSQQEFKEMHDSLTSISSNIRYQLSPINNGRAKIRNKLASEARYDYLLFLDCDSVIIRDDFVKKYISFSSEEKVVCGGTAYAENPPEDTKQYLHWLYGKKREVVAPEIRNKNPYNSFKTNNFAVSRRLFTSVFFDEHIVEYGHEDTLFGLELQKRGIKMLHIDNPVLHAGLDPHDIYLRKTRQAISNLVLISKKNDRFDTRLLKIHRHILHFHLGFFLVFINTFFEKKMERHLYSKKPVLTVLDLYKLCKLHEFYKNENIHR